MTADMTQSRHRILLVGSSSALLEGVSDLLQLAGYSVALSFDWAEARRLVQAAPPDLTILDVSDWVDSLQLPGQIEAISPSSGVPVLLLNFSGGDWIWHLQRVSGKKNGGRVEFYAHSLLGPDALLDKVKGCLS
jgi:response regulator RpfG family c-di-GMP phosphodiesterase